MKLDPNAPAFPFHDKFEDGTIAGHSYGLTIRAEIASRVLVGMMANGGATLRLEGNALSTPEDFAEVAIGLADSLITALNEEKP